MKSQVPRLRWWVHLILVGGYFIPGAVFALTHIQRLPALTSTPAGLLIVCGIQLAAFAIIFALACLISRTTSDELYLRWRRGWWVVPLGAGYSVALRLGVAIVAIIAGAILLASRLITVGQLQDFIAANRPQFERLVNTSTLQNSRLYFWLTVTLVSFVLAGLREEMWRAGTFAAMRNLWPRAFETSSGQYGAMAIIALVFGAAHLPLGIITAAFAGALGLFLGSIIVFHRSIWPAVLAHGFFDATSFALLPFALHKLQQLH